MRQQLAQLTAAQDDLTRKRKELDSTAEAIRARLQELDAHLASLTEYYVGKRQAATAHDAVSPAAPNANSDAALAVHSVSVIQHAADRQLPASTPYLTTSAPHTDHTNPVPSASFASSDGWTRISWPGKKRSIAVYLCQDLAPTIEPILPLLRDTLSASRGRSFSLMPVTLASTMPWVGNADDDQDVRPERPTCLVVAYFVAGARWLDKLKSEGFTNLQARASMACGAHSRARKRGSWRANGEPTEWACAVLLQSLTTL